MRQWLIDIRNQQNISQNEIANKCNITPAYYYMIENGKRNPSVKLAKIIAQKMNFDSYSKSWANFFE